jgi:lipopolysaccharide/colanic/teichoic acid biosynthesis glycosyltransferase
MRTHLRIHINMHIFKRLLDIIIALLGLILISPILLIIAVLIKLDSPGPVIYRHRRIGKDGRPFNLLKFRSMVCGGDDAGYMRYLRALIESERSENAAPLPYRKMTNDSRVTRVGNVLRCYYLDEFPQLVNILLGTMSLVGPRPHVQFEVDNYTLEQRRRLSVKPGATGLWQVEGKANCTFNELIQLDLDYIDHWSLWLDIQILFKTAVLMLRGGEGFWARMAKHIPARHHAIPIPATGETEEAASTPILIEEVWPVNIPDPVHGKGG